MKQTDRRKKPQEKSHEPETHSFSQYGVPQHTEAVTTHRGPGELAYIYLG